MEVKFQVVLSGTARSYDLLQSKFCQFSAPTDDPSLPRRAERCVFATCSDAASLFTPSQQHVIKTFSVIGNGFIKLPGT